MDDEIIAYVTKGLKPAYFQALMYVRREREYESI